MPELLAVRSTEGWTPVSITAGLILAVMVMAVLFWAIERASRK